ncbi:unnamed protein product [Linum trigynum]|uniref:Cytochrome b6-f complex subunit 7 n=1 Tax=Linum trigynum TaxID=586398 RepID=A0AAV2GJG7_9ROSI
MASAVAAAATVTGAVVTIGNCNTAQQKRSTTKMVSVGGLNSYGGLKAHNSVAALGQSVCADQGFAKIVSSMRKSGGGNGGGALSAKCSRVDEIFQIAAIMNGLTLVGVAMGFVLLRIEAAVEESE